MFELATPWWELILRVTVIYCALLFLLRLSGKRQLGQLTPMDLLTMLLVSETVSPALTAGDDSVPGGLIAAATLVGISVAIAGASYRSRRFEKAVEGTPVVVVRDGVIDRRVMRRERITDTELQIALRQQGIRDIADVRLAVVEPSGEISCLT
ncbi:MAG: DUF421 domain-containing protein [Tepidiformaceae bacterium]